MNAARKDNPEVADAILDLETGLAVARILYTNYFEQTGEGADLYFQHSRHDIGAVLGAIIDYIISAQETLEAIENQTA